MPIPPGLIAFGQAAGPWVTAATFTGSVLIKVFGDDPIEKKLDAALALLNEMKTTVTGIDKKCDEILTKVDAILEKIDVTALEWNYHQLDSALETASLLIGKDGHFVITAEHWSRLDASLLALFQDEQRIGKLPRVHCHAVFLTALTGGKLKPIIDTRIGKYMLPRLDKRMADLRKALEDDDKALTAALDPDHPPLVLRGIIEVPQTHFRDLPAALVAAFEKAFTRLATVRIAHNYDSSLKQMDDFRYDVTGVTGEAWNAPLRQIADDMTNRYIQDVSGRARYDAPHLVDLVPFVGSGASTAASAKPLGLSRMWHTDADTRFWNAVHAPGQSWYGQRAEDFHRYMWSYLVGRIGTYNALRLGDWLKPRREEIAKRKEAIKTAAAMLVELTAIRAMFQSFLDTAVPVIPTAEAAAPTIAVVDKEVTFGLPFAMLSEAPKTKDIPLTA